MKISLMDNAHVETGERDVYGTVEIGPDGQMTFGGNYPDRAKWLVDNTEHLLTKDGRKPTAQEVVDKLLDENGWHAKNGRIRKEA